MHRKLFGVAGVCLVSLSSAAPLAQAQAPAAAATPPAWQTTLSLGGNATRGNSETLTANGSVVGERKGGANEARVGAEANYGENQVTAADGTQETRTSVDNAKAFAAYRRLVSERVYGTLNADVLTDDIADIDYRVIVGPGVGVYAVRNEAVDLALETGVVYIGEKVGGQQDDAVALRLAERVEYRLSKTSKVWQTAEYLPKFDDFGDYLLNAEAGAEAAMNATLSLRVVAQNKHDSTPAADKEKDDFSIVGALVWKL